MKLALAFGLVLLSCLAPAPQQTPQTPQNPEPRDFASLEARAEQFFRDGSYARSRETYLQARELALEPADRRWVEFRLADTEWRARAASETSDPSEFEAAQHSLEVLVRDVQRIEDQDRVFAEAHESLGDFHWRRDMQDWGSAWPHYQAALTWWGRSQEIDAARARYLAIVWKSVAPGGLAQPGGWRGGATPDDVIENALKISKDPLDRARAHFVRAMTLRDRGGDPRGTRVVREFEAALEGGRAQPWYDDALFFYADWLASRGRVVRDPSGSWRQEPDYVAALKLYQRLAEEFRQGESLWRDDARRRAEEILAPTLSVATSNVFLPGSEVSFQLSWRNLARVDFALYPVDLARDTRYSGSSSSGELASRIDIAGKERVLGWSRETHDNGEHRPGNEQVRLERKLDPGAYVLEATAGAQRARELVLVSDAALVLKASGKTALAWFTDALSGAPIAAAQVNLWEHWHDGRDWQWRSQKGTTGDDGLARFELSRKGAGSELFVTAKSGARAALAMGSANGRDGDLQGWRIQAITDRPAYRPEDEVHWKLVARRFNGSVYSTPAGAKLAYTIQDPHGATVKEGVLELNAFGSAWGDLALSASLPLGEYPITFKDAPQGSWIGSAQLFRLEEYKLPEFQVSVQVPEVDGRKKVFRLGDVVEAEVRAELYSGGAVAGASVEVLVHQMPHYVYWRRPSPMPWLVDADEQRSSYWRGNEQVVKRETLRTDAEGRVRVSFETPLDASNDLEYRIEARVIDASRREVTGQGTVQVSRQGVFVFLQPRHQLHQPQDQVEIDIRAQDANGASLAVEGIVRVARERWSEIWVGPRGEQLSGDEFRKRFPLGEASEPGWVVQHRGYEREEILTHAASTGKDGQGLFTFTAPREGAYKIVWSSADTDGAPISAETSVWVTSDATTDLTWRRGELEILVDRESYGPDGEALAMLSTASSGAWVLFAVESEELLSWQVLHLEGTAKLVHVPLSEKHVPNAFLSAEMVHGGEIWIDVEELAVPPLQQFLTVEVTPDRNEVRPGEESTLAVTARDHRGEPVEAEISLALVDEAVFAIQSEYAVDPRQFFYGEKRPRWTSDSSSFQWRRYAKLVEKDGALIDQRSAGVGMKDQDEARLAEGDDFFLGRGGRRDMNVAKSAAREEMAEGKLEFQGALDAPAAMAGVAGEPAVTIRADFRATAVWQPDVVTGRDGRASVHVKYPETLTAWKATARAATRESRFGYANAKTRTDLPLTVRLQAPRFFVVGDEALVSAVIRNRTDQTLDVKPALLASGLTLANADGERAQIRLESQGETRVDWKVLAESAGTARLQVSARGAGGDSAHADAMEKSYPVVEHGIDKLLAKSGKLDPGGTITLELPRERKAGTTRLVVQVAPSIATTMLDALPYLVDYPYGCTEQTMSRFLPALVVQKTLRDLGLDPEVAMARVFGGVEGEYAAKTHPKGKKSLALLDEVSRRSLDRLLEFQHEDGGWGWWKDGESDRFMSAYIVWGLALARDAGFDVPAEAARRGAEFLDLQLVEAEDEPDLAAWMLHALAAHAAAARSDAPTEFQRAAGDRLWAQKDQLNAYTRALFALACHGFGWRERAQVLADNLANGVTLDQAPDRSLVLEGAGSANAAVQATAHWGTDGIYWRWSEGAVESTSTALRALLAIRPEHALIAPAMNWLVKNRRGAQWSSTRDTAIALLALDRYLKTSGEAEAELGYEVAVNGRVVAQRTIERGGALAAPGRFEIDPALVRDGANEIRIRRTSGKGPLYFAIEARFFSMEEPVTAAGNELFVRRESFRLAPRPTLLEGTVEQRIPLASGDAVESGERVALVVTIEAKNDLEYLMIEDLKPAGLEAAELQSGANVFARELKQSALGRRLEDRALPSDSDATGRTVSVHQELRDRKVAMFLDRLPQGVWEIRYEMRAEVPGRFHALPVVGQAMYVPEIRGNSVESLLVVR